MAIQFIAIRTPDGRVHVDNPWQHYVYSKRGFNKWLKRIKLSEIIVKEGICYCGLGPGWVRECDGEVWKDDKNRFP